MTGWKDDRKKAVQRKQKIPKMPEGYYSGDKPNPNLRAFVKAHLAERPYDPETDRYDVPPFDKQILIENRRDPINDLHIYWSKKPYQAIRQYISHYTNPGDLILDPFSGSGTTALAALMEGRKAIAIDRSPAATFITKNYCTPVDVDELRTTFEELKRKIKPEIDWLYETRCDRCGGLAMTAYTVYSQVFQCPRCMEMMSLFDCPEVEGQTKAGKPKMIRVCPNCMKRGIHEPIKSTGKHYGAMPVSVNYVCENGCKPARNERRRYDQDPQKQEFFQRYDLSKIQEIGEKKIPYWYPDADLSKAIPYRMLHKKDFRFEDASRLKDLFTKRNLWALSVLNYYISNDDVHISLFANALFGQSGCLYNATRMYKHREKGGGPQEGTYYIPQIFREVKVTTLFEWKINNIIKAADILNSNYDGSNIRKICISTQSATNFNQIMSNSIDYIFTDPPYAGNIQYGELNFVWEAWLGFDTNWHNEEIIVNEIRGKTEADWANDMRRAMSECFRVLKPGRAISLCYHDTSEGTWALLQDIMAEAGFIPEKTDSALFIDTGQKSYNQLTADKVNKRDLVINFRKPKPDEIGGQIITEIDDFGTFQEKAKNIISAYLSSHPGSTKDHIFDDLVSRMVRRGRMEPHHFDELLVQVAEPVHPEGEASGAARWYLRETGMEDSAESAKEEAAAEIIKGFISRTKKPEDEGVHYSDLFEHFVYTVRDKPRRPLVEWLLDYFYKTDEGTYRLPANPEEERVKKEGRSQGLSRRIKRYLSYIEQGVPVPEGERPVDVTLADWIRHCKRSGMYEQGKLLYEKGGINPESLTEEGQVNVDEDYQICVKMQARTAKPEKRTRRGRKAAGGEEN